MGVVGVCFTVSLVRGVKRMVMEFYDIHGNFYRLDGSVVTLVKKAPCSRKWWWWD